MMHGKLTASGAELAAKKLASKRWRGRGSSPDHPPKKFGLTRLMLMGRLTGIYAAGKDNNIMGDMAC